MRKLFVATMVGVLVALPAKANLTSTFDSSAEGWNAVDPTGDYTSSWQSSGGNPGGYLQGSETDPLGGTGYFYAPASWLGNWSAYAGGTISYDLKVFDGTDYFNDLDVIISNGSNSVSWSSNINPVGDGWVTFQVQLTAANFSGGSSLASILSNVTSFSIRGEFITGAEVEGLDNVRVAAVATGTPEPSTWAMLLMGFAGLGFAGWRAQRKSVKVTA
jgi:Laminin B (Domain IV)/PEP-CTERM motif